MNELLVVTCHENERLHETLSYALEGVAFERVSSSVALPLLAGRRVLFAIGLSEHGLDAEVIALIAALRQSPNLMQGSTGAILLDGTGELYTKQTADMLALAANLAGCRFPGKPLVEATGSLDNWNIQSLRRGVSLLGAYRQAARELVQRLLEFSPKKKPRPKVLLLHASDRTTSNTLQIGMRISEKIEPYCDIHEISLINGAIFDCRGCSYKTCSHFARQNSCFYGGVITNDVYPAINECDALLLLCPNYNDSVSANILAFINRLTSVVVYNGLYDKQIFSVIVSGYSGSDIIAQQVIGALCLNKTFSLPPRFCLMQTANNPGEAMQAEGIEERIDAFAARMLESLYEKDDSTGI
ncbi:MAG: NADPH-dependent oxidoreductase [Firmicutes bacterium HGW-Firmicutes-9]|jgi:multimeric flavodoxin WrbA|nr:MAG: NADPH-dependent oxidoreductase [Firmicutes bacterium HGW-Firmicutes-9]